VHDPSHLDGEFDVVTMFDVIEHFENPRQDFASIDNLIRPRGHLIITTPNPTHVQDIHSWYHLWPGQHMYLWTPPSLKTFMGDFGYRCVEEHYAEGLLRTNDPTPDSILYIAFKKE